MFRGSCQIAFLLVIATWLPAGAQPADDRDADGVLDFYDNCLTVPNGAQVDTDRDGFGNLCDADFDNNGIVDEADESFMIDHLASQEEPLDAARQYRLLRLLDLNGDGQVDDLDLGILMSRLRTPPGPVQDTDGDGMGDGRDPCLNTRPGSLTVFPGCSALDLMQRPGAALDRPERSIVGALDTLSGMAGMADLRGSLTAAEAALTASRRKSLAGDPCGGRDAAAEALTHIVRAEKLAREHVDRAHSQKPPANNEGDVTVAELDLLPLSTMASRISGAVEAVRASHDGFDAVCKLAQPFELTGKVRSLNDGERTMEIGELQLGLADGLELKGAMSEGVEGSVSGLHFADGTGVITAAQFVELGDLIVANSCLKFRFVPVQRMAPQFQGPYLMHDPEAYRIEKRYMFEGGMRFAAENVCDTDGPAGGPIQGQAFNGPFKRFSLTVLLDYITRDGFARNDAVMAYDLEPGDTPLPLWREIDPDKPVTVKVSTRMQECVHDGSLAPIGSKESLDCGTPQFLRQDVYELSMREIGERCAVVYDRTLFDLDDQVSTSRDATWVSAVVPVAVWDQGTTPVFTAEGYALCRENDRWVPCPYTETIYENHSFAIRNLDFFPVHDNGEFEWLEDFTGVRWASGLQWPKVNGINNGLPWQLSCTLPRVVRDVVNFCPGGTDAYYRLPFAYGNHSWVQSQANMSTATDATHAGVYAYDMVAPCGETIRAARAGVVESVVESGSQQVWDDCSDTADCDGHTCCPDDKCGANAIVIRHQDNSIARYLHSPMNGIVPEAGEIVRRGEVLGFVGTTGNSSGPHLHFDVGVRDQNGNFDSRLGLFEAIHSEDHSTMTCYEPPDYPSPASADYRLRSNNREWP